MGKVFAFLLVLMLAACATPVPDTISTPEPSPSQTPLTKSPGKMVFVEFFAVN
jgi:hypothetical protein